MLNHLLIFIFFRAYVRPSGSCLVPVLASFHLFYQQHGNNFGWLVRVLHYNHAAVLKNCNLDKQPLHDLKY